MLDKLHPQPVLLAHLRHHSLKSLRAPSQPQQFQPIRKRCSQQPHRVTNASRVRRVARRAANEVASQLEVFPRSTRPQQCALRIWVEWTNASRKFSSSWPCHWHIPKYTSTPACSLLAGFYYTAHRAAERPCWQMQLVGCAPLRQTYFFLLAKRRIRGFRNWACRSSRSRPRRSCRACQVSLKRRSVRPSMRPRCAFLLQKLRIS